MTQLLRQIQQAAISPADLARQLVLRQRAKQHLIEYAQFIDENYRPYPVHRYIAERLEDVEAGRIRRLAIFLPPATGKSRLASELFPSWCFGRDPSLEVIQASYSYDLAKGFGRVVRNLVKEPRFTAIFPETEVAADASSMDEWGTTRKGEYKAEGVGGGLVGFHANIAVIDDPVKGYAEAASPTERKKGWDWYSGTLLNRLRSYKGGPGAVVLIMQRWHDDDLGGRIEKLNDSGEERWTIIRLPSIAEENDPLGRAFGEILLPEGPNQRTMGELEQLRSRNPELFMALHQQKPVADEGDVFNPGWLRKYGPDELPKKLVLYGASDYALTKGGGDYTVHMVFGVDSRRHVWILEMYRGQVDSGDAVEHCIQLMRFHKPLKWYNEKFAITKAIGPLLARRKNEERVWTILESVSMQRAGDKVAKAGSAAGAMRMGWFHVPADAPWVGEMEWELSRFPSGKNDDIVDTLSLIGMKLESLIGAHGEQVQESKILELHPSGFTFNDMRERSRKRRLGLHVSHEAPLFEAPRCEWLERAG